VVAGGQISKKTYLTSLHEDIFPLLAKVVGDRSANPHREAASIVLLVNAGLIPQRQ
jgi:hypothetical protein